MASSPKVEGLCIKYNVSSNGLERAAGLTVAAVPVGQAKVVFVFFIVLLAWLDASTGRLG